MIAARNPLLLAGGVASGLAALAHAVCVIGGPTWYRAMGAPPGFVRAAGRGMWTPALVTIGIAAMLVVWSVYALSGAGIIARLPLLRPALVAITAVYLARGLIFFAPSLLRRPDLSPGFLLWSSAIVLVIGVTHAVGLWRGWNAL